MKIEVRLFATLRETVGESTITLKFEKENIRVEESLRELQEEYPDTMLFEDGSRLHDHIRVLKNGQEIDYLSQLDTELEDDDTLAVFPPVSGG